MPPRTDWLDFAHKLDREREAMQDRLPKGVDCSLTLASYEFGTSYGVSLTHTESKCGGYGTGRTPAKALEDATERLKKNLAEWSRRPRLTVAEPLAIEGK